MAENHETHDGMKRRGYLKGIAATGLSAGALTAATGSTYADSDDRDDRRYDDGEKEDEKETHDIDGDSLYLVFGADAKEDDLDEWVYDHRDELDTSTQDSVARVVQYQDVSQLNVTEQGNAISIAIDGGEATATQQTEQDNSNTQEGTADSINVDETETDRTFDDVGNAYIVFAEETESREFSGWVVAEETYGSDQAARAAIEQTQEVDQFNYSSQSSAVAIAEHGSCAEAYQQSSQTNANYQQAGALAANIGGADAQDAEASVDQAQEVSQLNVSEQGVAIAIAVGDGSVARAYQVSSQFNMNEQVAEAAAINFDSMSVDEVTACANMVGEFSRDDMTRVEEEYEDADEYAEDEKDEKKAEKDEKDDKEKEDEKKAEEDEKKDDDKGKEDEKKAEEDEKKDDDKKKDDKKPTQSNGQQASAVVSQVQRVGQENINLQNAAMAVAIDDSDATARQESYQGNFNAQVASAEAVNVDEGVCNLRGVVSGTDAYGDESWAIAYDNGNGDTVQIADAEVDQLQFVEQLNINEQHAAVAFATDCGEAVAEHLNYQLNENVQLGEATAANEAAEGDDYNEGEYEECEDGEKEKTAEECEAY
jgi:hypothetical protein